MKQAFLLISSTLFIIKIYAFQPPSPLLRPPQDLIDKEKKDFYIWLRSRERRLRFVLYLEARNREGYEPPDEIALSVSTHSIPLLINKKNRITHSALF